MALALLREEILAPPTSVLVSALVVWHGFFSLPP
jgi:hypothetical protein